MHPLRPRATAAVLGLALALGCQAREPASAAAPPAPAANAEQPAARSNDAGADAREAQAKADPSPTGKLRAEDLVHVELGRVPDAAREALRARLGAKNPLEGAGALVAVHLHIEPQWHIYWINPGESGLRTRIDGEAEGARLGEVLYPAPHRIVAEGGQVSYGWDDDAVLFVPLRVLEGNDGAELSLRTRYLVCRESCIPGEAKLSAKLDELPARDDALTAAMLERVPEPAGARVSGEWSEGQLRLRGAEGVALAELFPYASNEVALDEQQPAGEGLTLTYRFTGEPQLPAQGVLRATVAGTPRWLELALPWPATPS